MLIFDSKIKYNVEKVREVASPSKPHFIVDSNNMKYCVGKYALLDNFYTHLMGTDINPIKLWK